MPSPGEKAIDVNGWNICVVEDESTGIFMADLGDSWLIEYPGGIGKKVVLKSDMRLTPEGYYVHKSNPENIQYV